MMRKLALLLMIVTTSCHHQNKNRLIGKWQLLKKSNGDEVVFQFNAGADSKKYIYWFKDDSTLITKDDDGGNMKSNTYLLSTDKITLFDSSHSNTFFFKVADNKLSMKSVYSPFRLELKKVD